MAFELISKCVKAVLLSFTITLIYGAFVLLRICPPLHRLIISQLLKNGDARPNPDDVIRDMGGMSAYSAILRRYVIHVWRQKARQGGEAPNCRVIDLSTRTECHLFDYMHRARPLVLNFGSLSWPPFLLTKELFDSVVKEFEDIADFLIVYISEAHPTDGWVIDDNRYQLANHRSIDDRLQAAAVLVSHGVPCPVVVDTMAMETELQYAAEPERLFVLLEGYVLYEGGEGPFGYQPSEVRRWLEQYRHLTLSISKHEVKKAILGEAIGGLPADSLTQRRKVTAKTRPI